MKIRIFTLDMCICHSLRAFCLFFKIILHHVIGALPSESEQAKVATSCTFLQYENTVHLQSIPSDQTGNQHFHREVAAVSQGASPPKMPLNDDGSRSAVSSAPAASEVFGPLLKFGGAATLKGATAKIDEGKSEKM